MNKQNDIYCRIGDRLCDSGRARPHGGRRVAHCASRLLLLLLKHSGRRAPACRNGRGWRLAARPRVPQWEGLAGRSLPSRRVLLGTRLLYDKKISSESSGAPLETLPSRAGLQLARVVPRALGCEA
jgi:hypothetical protein